MSRAKEETAPPVSEHRATTYYWKSDRPAAFHGTKSVRKPGTHVDLLEKAVGHRFPGRTVKVRPANGQGNHLTFLVELNGTDWFARVEDGPEQDGHLDVETRVMSEVGAIGVPVPQVIASDASRTEIPFAWQVMEKIDAPDLNHWHKQHRLNLPDVAESIGQAVARWQAICFPGFGPFNAGLLRREDRLQGYHTDYDTYFHLHLEHHLDFLKDHAFLTDSQAAEIRRTIADHRDLLALEDGCLVHKDLALWNILGTPQMILAFIDWDDAIMGDPMDDLSLLGCFYDGPVVERALHGYAAIRTLPEACRSRFWLHLLRNMLVKAVIRVGAGYFNKDERFFLLEPGTSGAAFKTFTQTRLCRALEGLQSEAPIETL
jgi:aminoglycoside phosphotransferase (APT) family kinase protein